MNTKTVQENTLKIIDHYLNFRYENSISNIPYYNNKRKAIKGFRAETGKGSPGEILDLIKEISIKEKLDIGNLNNDDFKKFLVEADIGIDCSGFAYYLLNEESKAIGKGPLDKHLKFPYQNGLVGKIVAKIKPIEHTDVATFTHQRNSRVINLNETKVGDFISIIVKEDNVENPIKERNHILFIHQIEYQNWKPITIHYSHSIAWPEDGLYGHGVRQSKIEILDLEKKIAEQRWLESNFIKDNKYNIEIRRLNWFE